MITKIFSLIKPLYVRNGYKLRKCVNPPLVGAVLAVTLVLSVSAPAVVHAADAQASASDELYTTKNGTVNIYSDAYGTVYNANNDINSGFFNVDFTSSSDISGKKLMYEFTRIVLEFPYDVLSQSYTLNGTTYKSYDQLLLSDITLHLFVNGVEHILYPTYYSNGNGVVGDYPSRVRRVTFASDKALRLYTTPQGSLSTIYGYISFYQMEPLDKLYSDGSRESFVNFNTVGYFNYKIYFTEGGVSDTDLTNSTNTLINQGNQDAISRWEEDRQDASDAGSDMTGLASDLDNVRNAWEILWYPIEFTNRFIQVFLGGTQSAAYEDEYQYVTGYRYNDETGFLEPVMARTVQPVSVGTGITFPSFELMGMTIWDSYTYDLSSITTQFPVIFDSLYVIVSILEMLWFVSYLRNKYDEVFG